MTPAQPDDAALHEWRDRCRRELYESVIPFWMNHSLDRENGGYYNCLDRDGSVWDTTKHVWLQGRQVWMLAKLANEAKDASEEQRTSWRDASGLGARFLRRHARRDDGRVYFSLTPDGRPVFMQRKIFSECFYIMGLSEYARASGEEEYREEARAIFEKVLEWSRDLTKVGRPSFEGAPAGSTLAIPMILLNLIDELSDPGETTWAATEGWCVEQIDKHIKPELKLVLEHVGPGGEIIDETAFGRVVSPGHAIEAGWFLLDYARRTAQGELERKALQMIEWSLDYGWDPEFGGLYYFMDSRGFSPVQLEWNMKLWWPHNEAMVATLMAYRATGEARWWEWFVRVAEYAFARFSDPEHGEWFGYLDRRGERTHRFKGGPYKGCFHVPRALYLSSQLLE